MRLQAAVHTVAGKRSDGLSDFERALAEIRWNRYFVPEVHVSIGAKKSAGVRA